MLYSTRAGVIVLFNILLVAIVSSAPLSPVLPEAGATVRPAIEAFKAGPHWIVSPETLPRVRPGASTSSSSLLERIRSLGRAPARVKTTQQGDLKMINQGTSPRLFEFGSKDKVYLIQPKTTGTLARSDLTEQQFRALSIQKIPKDTRVNYNDL